MKTQSEKLTQKQNEALEIIKLHIKEKELPFENYRKISLMEEERIFSSSILRSLEEKGFIVRLKKNIHAFERVKYILKTK